ncbi:hypothetical protein H8D85_01140 [bacterium]|nr:hypothetical protein [bacterium]
MMLALEVNKEIVQVITDDFKGMGTVKSVYDDYIVLEPHTDDKLIEEFGESVSHDIIIPLKRINLIIKMTNGSKEDSSNKNKKSSK